MTKGDSLEFHEALITRTVRETFRHNRQKIGERGRMMSDEVSPARHRCKERMNQKNSRNHDFQTGKNKPRNGSDSVHFLTINVLSVIRTGLTLVFLLATREMSLARGGRAVGLFNSRRPSRDCDELVIWRLLKIHNILKFAFVTYPTEELVVVNYTWRLRTAPNSHGHQRIFIAQRDLL